MVVPNISKQFGIAIRDRRLAAGLTQERLAELAKLHPTYIGMVERGIRNPTLAAADRIAKGLEISLPQLISEAQGQGVCHTKGEIRSHGRIA